MNKKVERPYGDGRLFHQACELCHELEKLAPNEHVTKLLEHALGIVAALGSLQRTGGYVWPTPVVSSELSTISLQSGVSTADHAPLMAPVAAEHPELTHRPAMQWAEPDPASHEGMPGFSVDGDDLNPDGRV